VTSSTMTIQDDDGALLLRVVAEVPTATDTTLSRIETVINLLLLASLSAASIRGPRVPSTTDCTPRWSARHWMRHSLNSGCFGQSWPTRCRLARMGRIGIAR